MQEFVRLRSGRTLARTVADLDQDRPNISNRKLRSICYAPFVSMDFDAIGSIRICNHSHVAIAEMSEGTSVLEVWRGEIYKRFRREMSGYILDDENCCHCVRQCEAGARSHMFAVEQFDAWAHDDPNPLYPKRLIFRLNNTCNLACIMCDGMTSSRVRIEREQLPPLPSKYGERFFDEMGVILPHVDHVEFYGGEPFLVKEHVRIFEILRKVNARCTIYINTNGVSLHPKARMFLEELNFKTIAVSMDAVSGELHQEIRKGLRNDLFHKNMSYFLDLRARRGIDVMLNVTEHRKNWFELPEIFRFAETNQLYLHINTCIHPHNVTLYTLPSDELRYVLSFLEAKREELLHDYPSFSNLPSYDFLLSLIRSELDSRSTGWEPVVSNRNQACDGLLGTPIAGLIPFETPRKVLLEADRIVNSIGSRTARMMLCEMLKRIRTVSNRNEWLSIARKIEHLIAEITVDEPA